jgi:hypothetical protein
VEKDDGELALAGRGAQVLAVREHVHQRRLPGRRVHAPV